MLKFLKSPHGPPPGTVKPPDCIELDAPLIKTKIDDPG